MGIPSDFARHVADNETTPVWVSVDSKERTGANVNYGAGTAIFEALNPEPVHTLSSPRLPFHGVCAGIQDETVALYESSCRHPVGGPREAILER